MKFTLGTGFWICLFVINHFINHETTLKGIAFLMFALMCILLSGEEQ
jgi:hypothetical protein